MPMICPKCGGPLTNKNVNYTYSCRRHRKVLKKCYACGTEIEDIRVDTCPSCRAWLPDFPTSWGRSATDIFFLRRIAGVVKNSLRNQATVERLARYNISHGLTSVDEQRLREEGETYFRGAPRRRAAEYVTIMKYLGLAHSLPESSEETISMTPLGEEFCNADTKLDFDTVAIHALLTLMLTNGYDRRGTYSLHHFRPVLLALKLLRRLEHEGIEATLERFALAFMCRDEVGDFERAFSLARGCSSELINEYFFSESKEIKRSIQGMFLRWMEAIGLVETIGRARDLRIGITDVGRAVINPYSERKPIWYSDLEGPEEAANAITEGQELDFFMAIPSSERTEVLSALARRMEAPIQEALEMVSRLQVRPLAFLNSLIAHTTEAPETLSLKLAEEERRRRPGETLERLVLRALRRLGLRARFYRGNRIFARVELSARILASLPGGTRNNPDLIVTHPCLLLVDPKNDAGTEMHKVRAYDGYASHPEVNGFALVVTNLPLSRRKIEMLKGTERVSVFTKGALDTLVANEESLNSENTCLLLIPSSEKSKYVDEERIFPLIPVSAENR